MIQELVLYKPHEIGKKAHQSKARNRVLAFGRQGGKSTWGANELADKAWISKRKVYWFFEPSYDQAKVQYRRFLEEFPRDCGIYRKAPNDSELRLFLNSSCDIQYKTGGALHRVRGETLGGVIIDEVRDQPKELYSQILPPMLAIHKAWVAYLSTPNGFDGFYDLSVKAQTDTTGDWEYFHAPSTCNPRFSQEEFERLKREMSEAEFAQEILAEFRQINRGAAYWAFSQLNQSSVSPLVRLPHTHTPLVGRPAPESLETQINPFLPIHLACDFNVNYMGWVMSQFRHGMGHYAFQEIWIPQKTNTHETIEVFIEKFRGYEKELGQWRADPQVILLGDSTGSANKTSAAGETDWKIIENALRKAGISFKNLVSSSNPSVKDRVNTVNARLKAADGTVNAWLNPKTCPNLLRDLQQVTWKQNADGAILDQTTDPERTHLSDAWGYDICITNPISSVKDVGSLRVIRR